MDDRKVEEIVRGESQRLDFLSLLFFPFGLLLGVVSALVGTPFVAFLVSTQAWSRRRFRRTMRKQGRFVPWRDLERRLMDGEGTVIEEVGLKGAQRVWWTPDDVASMGRLPSSYEEVGDVLEGAPHAFNDRCLAEYLDPERGRAMTTAVSLRAVRSGALAGRFPRSRWVKVVRPLFPPSADDPQPEG